MKIYMHPESNSLAEALQAVIDMNRHGQPATLHIDANPLECAGITTEILHKLQFAGAFGSIVLVLMDAGVKTRGEFNGIALKYFLEQPKAARKLAKEFKIKNPDEFGSSLYALSEQLKNPEFRAMIESLEDPNE